MTTLVVASAGPFTSVQDLGRFGAQRYGLTTSGAMDKFALACANVLLGNDGKAAGIEMGPFPASFLARNGDIRIAVTGAGRDVRVEGHSLPMHETAMLRDGSRLDIGPAREGMFSVLGVEGGIPGEPVFGSLSVTARIGIGSPFPRPLKAGDEIDVSAATQRDEHRLAIDPRPMSPIRVVAGPQSDEFGEALQLFFESDWKVSAASDRMGYRLEGPPLVHMKGHNIVSDGTVNGSIQVPGNGQPIVLLADRGTTGGYPKIATVIGPDLGALAQRRAGQTIRFAEVSIEQAQTAARRFADEIDALHQKLRPTGGMEATAEALINANLAGSAVNAVDVATWQISARAED